MDMLLFGMYPLTNRYVLFVIIITIISVKATKGANCHDVKKVCLIIIYLFIVIRIECVNANNGVKKKEKTNQQISLVSSKTDK